jgi:hypothetical protein
MSNLVEELLEKESAKHQALIAGDAAAYEERVKEQLQLVSTNRDYAAAARECPAKVEILERMIRLNTLLLLNQFSASPVFGASGLLGRSEYTSGGTLEARPASRFSVDM